MRHEFQCSICHEHKTHESDFSTGYATDSEGNKICFECCGKKDAETLSNLGPKDKFSLYLNTRDKVLTNWPGTLKINVPYIRTGRHNMAGKRYDTWFSFAGKNFHAVQYGDNTMIAHIKAVKS
jgi:hypothetical protein